MTIRSSKSFPLLEDELGGIYQLLENYWDFDENISWINNEFILSITEEDSDNDDIEVQIISFNLHQSYGMRDSEGHYRRYLFRLCKNCGKEILHNEGTYFSVMPLKHKMICPQCGKNLKSSISGVILGENDWIVVKYKNGGCMLMGAGKDRRKCIKDAMGHYDGTRNIPQIKRNLLLKGRFIEEDCILRFGVAKDVIGEYIKLYIDNKIEQRKVTKLERFLSR